MEPLMRILTYTFPKLQRNLVEDHILSMVNDQKAEYSKNKCYSMLQSICVASLNGELFVLDGQHRICAFSRLAEEGYPITDVMLPVVVYNVESKEELAQYYQRINKHMPIHPFEIEETWETLGKYICSMMEKYFHHYIKNTTNGSTVKSCRCPHISLHELKTHMQARNIHEKLREYNCTNIDLWDSILSINTYIAKEIKAHHQLCTQSMRRLQECEAKSQKYKCLPCFLGIWRKFEWLDIALFVLSKGKVDIKDVQINIAKFTEQRMKIPFQIREQVWKKTHENMCDEGKCYCCNSILRFPDMECGHIVAHALGGKSNVDNFMPICKTCNRDMGVMNLYEYKNMLDKML